MNSRRRFIRNSAGTLGMLSLPSLLSGSESAVKKKIIVVGGHPDDPESGCGGTIVQLVKNGHNITLMYLTNGDAGIPGKSLQEAAAIRKNESIAACKVLGAEPLFAGQVDGDTILNNSEKERFTKLLEAQQPDLVFTHWPIDSHKDHQVASILTIRAWLETGRSFPLYFYEVCTGVQTFGFHPTDYVDITDVHKVKIEALTCHKSQNIAENGKYTKEFYGCGHPSMEDFRGRELGVTAAEAFVRMTGRGFGKFEI